VSKSPGSPFDNYQESVTAPVGKDSDDDNAANQVDEPEDETATTETRHALNILTAVEKVISMINLILPMTHSRHVKLRKIVRAVRSSPQRRRAWLNEVRLSLSETENTLFDEITKMLILDVATRWSSTHQMIHKHYNVYTSSQTNAMFFRTGTVIPVRH
jgi:hypothetical protein